MEISSKDGGKILRSTVREKGRKKMVHVYLLELRRTLMEGKKQKQKTQK